MARLAGIELAQNRFCQNGAVIFIRNPRTACDLIPVKHRVKANQLLKLGFEHIDVRGRSRWAQGILRQSAAEILAQYRRRAGRNVGC